MNDDSKTIRFMLDGLISRDVSCGEPLPEDHPYWSSPEGKEAKEKAAASKKAYENDELRMVTLSEGGSIKIIEVNRARLRSLMGDGWVFDEETTKWGETK